MNKDNIKDILVPKVLIKYAERKGYRLFNGTLRGRFKDYDVNIWGIRNNNQQAGEFDDLLVVFWKVNNHWEGLYIDCTLDPSDYYLLNPIHKLGTAIIKPNQYKRIWQLGKHSGYDALVQRKPITVIRDFNKDILLDYQFHGLKYLERRITPNNQSGHTTKYYTPDGKVVHIEDTGFFGINLHRASKWKLLRKIGLYSAGCVVVRDYNHYNKLIDILKKGANNWGNSFTFTLITESDLLNTVGFGKNSTSFDLST